MIAPAINVLTSENDKISEEALLLGAVVDEGAEVAATGHKEASA
jgi:hypothetical protein